MYLDYFSLKRHPFRITPDPSLFFPGGSHGRGVVLDALVYAITSGEGILKVVGEVGSGKTMLCRMLEERLPASVEIVYLANPNLSARDIIYAIAFELKLEVEASTDRLVVMHKLQNYLLQRHSVGASVVVFIEEAQSMPLETLEEVRLLSNLETHRHKLMQIVLFGQPELDRKLQDKSIRQLRERITHCFNLEPLTADEVREYLHFRLQTAGCPWPQLFSPKSERLLAKASEGLTRRINILADKALLASYADPAVRQEARSSTGEILPMVLPRHVNIAIADSAYGGRFVERYLPYSGYAVAVVALWLLVIVLFKYVWTGAGNQLSAIDATASTPVSQTAGEQTSSPQMQNTVPVSAVSQASDTAITNGVTLPAELASGRVDKTASAPNTDIQMEAEQPPGSDARTAINPDIENISSDVSAELPATIPQDVATAAESLREVQSEAMANADTGNNFLESTIESPSKAVASGEAENENAGTATNVPATIPGTAHIFTGLGATRSGPSAEWLAGLPSRVGYTIQIFSGLTRQPEKLEEFLEVLASNMMLDNVFLCVISGNDARPEQWLVLYDEFTRLSEAQKLIEGFPSSISQYAPYTRNLNDIACAN